MRRPTPALRTAAWLGRQLARTPALWLIVASLALIGALRASLGRIGIALTNAHPWADVYDVAFLGGLPVVALALWVRSRHGWAAQPLGRFERYACDSAFLAGAAALGIAAAAVLARRPMGPLGWVGAGTCVAHLTALALLVGRCRTHPGLPPALLVAALWWIPASSPGDSWLWGSLGEFLSGPLQSQTQMPALVDMAPAVAFCLAAWLLTPRHPRA